MAVELQVGALLQDPAGPQPWIYMIAGSVVVVRYPDLSTRNLNEKTAREWYEARQRRLHADEYTGAQAYAERHGFTWINPEEG